MKIINILAYGGVELYDLLELACTCQSLRDDLPRRDLNGTTLAVSREEDYTVDEVDLPVTLWKEECISIVL
jgi:hypothetical protein